MAYRGGWGRGRGGQSLGAFAKQEKYEIFPEINEYPDVNLKQKQEEYRDLLIWGDELRKVWIRSYHLGSIDPEKNVGKRKIPLSDFVMTTDDYVPAELASKNVRRSNKKVRWNPQSDLQRLDFFERLDQGAEGQDDEKEKKEDEDDDDENIEEEEEDSGDDYDQNPDFDDDEDDFNMDEDIGDDAGCY